MKKTSALIGILIILLVAFLLQRKMGETTDSPTVLAALTDPIRASESPNGTPSPISFKQPTASASITIPIFASQTYNNCGPATLSMILAYEGKPISQAALASDLRPFNNLKGGVDDKEVFPSELAAYAKQLGFQSLVRPNGSIELLKKLITNGYPVMVTQWLHPGEDIGHYRIVKGFDDKSQKITVDDSYVGPNQTYSYEQFNELWQPFNYTYLLIYADEKEPEIVQILGPDADINTAYQNAIKRSQQELEKDPNDFYAEFNLSTANYYLGDFAQSVEHYEKSAPKLPSRMLWYQLEPLYSYQQVGEDEKVLEISDRIINNGNLGYADLYQLKGEIYLKQGKKDLAKQMFEKSLFYNKNYDKPKESLKKLY